MLDQWKIPVPIKQAKKLQIPQGDPSQSLVSLENYAHRVFPKAFTNFEVLLPLLRSARGAVLDATVFYSRRKYPLIVKGHDLSEHNHHAFNAAKNSGGLIVYFQGNLLAGHHGGDTYLDPDLDLDFIPDCMSFCIWESLQQAKIGAGVPAHKEAAAKVNHWYTNFAIEKFEITIEKSERVGQKFEDIVFRRVPKVEHHKALQKIVPKTS